MRIIFLICLVFSFSVAVMADDYQLKNFKSKPNLGQYLVETTSIVNGVKTNSTNKWCVKNLDFLQKPKPQPDCEYLYNVLEDTENEVVAEIYCGDAKAISYMRWISDNVMTRTFTSDVIYQTTVQTYQGPNCDPDAVVQ